MNTEARRRASSAYHAKRVEAGQRKVTVWLSQEARDLLDEAVQKYGSKDAAVEAAIVNGLGDRDD